MARRTQTLLAAIALAAATISMPAMAQDDEIKGIVVTNTDGVLTIKTPAGDQNVRLGSGVRVRSISGPLGGQKEDAPVASLIAGLPVTIEVDRSSGEAVASGIDYKASDYKTAAQIQAGVQETARAQAETAQAQQETARREAELRASYEKVGQWEVRAEKIVYFKTGSAVISPADKKELTTLAQRAKTINGYVISVLGYADPRGGTASNERLSQKRAETVINYLKQTGEVLPGKVMSASAMGEVQPAGAADAASDASARRVIVRVVTSKAMLPPRD